MLKLLAFLPILNAFSPILPTTTENQVSSSNILPLYDFNWHFVNNQKDIAIDGFSPIFGEQPDLDIAPYYSFAGQQCKVTTISNDAFFRNNIKNVVLPSTIQSIGDFAFSELNAPSIADDTSTSDVTNREVNIDISTCNDISYIGEYCFHGDTTNYFKLPTNNNVLNDLGCDAFTNITFLHDLDFSGFKAATTIGEWEFYGSRNGINGQGSNKLIIPNNLVNTVSSVFTNTDSNYIYWNVKYPSLDSIPASDNHSHFAPKDISFFLSSIKELHVQQGADLNAWKNLILNNSLNGFVYVDKLIADIQSDGQVGTPTSEIDNIGTPFTFSDIQNAVLQLLQWKIPYVNFTLGDVTSLIPYVDAILSIPNNPIIQLLVNEFFPNADIDWTTHMYQCELFCLWDNYFKYAN